MNIHIEYYTVFLECLLTFYYFHKMLQPVYPSRLIMPGIYIVYSGLLFFTTIHTPMFFRLGIVGLFLFSCYHFYLKQSAIKTVYTIVLLFVTAMLADLIGGVILFKLGIPVQEMLGISAHIYIVCPV